MIKFQNVVKNYGDLKAVNDISFNIKKGKIVGFLGPNGAGKSTTLKILTGYIPPNNGKVEIDGVNILENSLDARSKIGYLPETTPVYKNMNVVEYLKFIMKSREVPKEKQKERLDFVIKKLGLENMAYKLIGNLSKGYKQRVGIAQAMIHDPKILILDEPTSGLDPNQVLEIRDLIKEIGKDKTVIFSTHILQEVEALCDDIVIINNGKIVAEGKKKDIISNDKHLIKIIVKGDKDIIEKSLEKIDGFIRMINKKSSEENEMNYEIESKKDIREEVFNTALNNNFIILEIYKIKVNLEEIFKQLTA